MTYVGLPLYLCRIKTKFKHLKLITMKETENMLNTLLANYAVHYQNLRAMHWNVQGPEFFMLHAKFEEEYLDAQEAVDAIAERILALGSKPKSRFSVYLTKSEISEFAEYESAEQAIGFLLDSVNVLLKHENEILKLAAASADEGTVALMSDLIGKQEKIRWMFAATINTTQKEKSFINN